MSKRVIVGFGFYIFLLSDIVTFSAFFAAHAALRMATGDGPPDIRAGHYERRLQTKAGEVRLKIPKLSPADIRDAIIERYGQREELGRGGLIKMYLAGVLVRRMEDITRRCAGTRVSPSTVSDLNKKIYGTIEAWRNWPIEGEHPYVHGVAAC